MISPGTLLQNRRYRVIHQVGKGGMGTVYLARDEHFGSDVALKENHFNEPHLRRAFEREAHLLHNLRHPALTKVTDYFAEGSGQFLVMEFVPGEDLSLMRKQRGRPFDLADVLSWADQLLDALNYLHTQEPPVLHRDIKPRNLKLMRSGQIILLDFGLAKPSTFLGRVTAGGSVHGFSQPYASLEQIRGNSADPRSDLYSLNATLYHLIADIKPPDALTRADDVLNGQPDPLRFAGEVRAEVPASVSTLLARGMSLNANHRPQTAAQMRDMLRAVAGLPLLAPRPRPEAVPVARLAAADPATAAHPPRSPEPEDSELTRVLAARPGRARARVALGVAAAVLLSASGVSGLYFYTRRRQQQQPRPVQASMLAADSPQTSSGEEKLETTGFGPVIPSPYERQPPSNTPPAPDDAPDAEAEESPRVNRPRKQAPAPRAGTDGARRAVKSEEVRAGASASRRARSGRRGDSAPNDRRADSKRSVERSDRGRARRSRFSAAGSENLHRGRRATPRGNNRNSRPTYAGPQRPSRGGRTRGFR